MPRSSRAVRQTDGVILAAVVLAQEIDLKALVEPILATGVVGAVLLLVAFDKGLTTTASRDRVVKAVEGERDAARADLEEAKALIREFNETMRDQIAPALTRSIDVQREYVEALRSRRP